ncbi:hypothetical protein ACFX2A_038303 [Malus domestica]
MPWTPSWWDDFDIIKDQGLNHKTTMMPQGTFPTDFVSIAEGESTAKDDSLKAALAELFPRSSSAKLHHLKPLYVTAHIEGYPVSKVFVDCGATVNIMPLNIMKALCRSND